jgi:hypothetical protein
MTLCFAFFDDFCSSISTGFLVICVIYLACKGIAAYCEYAAEKEAQEAAARKAREEEEFQRNHPEAWRAREMVKLEKERLEAEQKLAAERAKREAAARGIGIVAGIGRGLGWW